MLPIFATMRIIGIIGAGHIGLTLAEVFLETLIQKKNLYISGSEKSENIAVIKKIGLTENLRSNEWLCTETDMTFIAIRPQDFREFKKMEVNTRTVFVSCMAGVSLGSVERVFGSNVCRIMSSGPATITAKKAIVAIYPNNPGLAGTMEKAGFEIFRISDEKDMHYFTVGVCLPAAIVRARILGTPMNEAINIFSERYGLFGKLFQWALTVVPDFESEKQMDDYVQKMSTSGGITEAIVKSLAETNDFAVALEAGIDRSTKLSIE
jgi:pyrroline-5-carboxylate reductase